MPVAKKYQNVQSKLSGQTGATSKNQSAVSDQLVAKRKGEKYKRIKGSTLAKLMTEHNYEESIYNLNENMSDAQSQQESLGGLLATGHNNVANSDTKSMASHRSDVTGVSAVTYATEMLGLTD